MTRAMALSIGATVAFFAFLRWAQSTDERRETAITILQVGQGAAILALGCIILTIALRKVRR